MIDRLTLETLEVIPPNKIFAAGIGMVYSAMKDRQVKVRWVAKRGTIHDWVIYYSEKVSIMGMELFDDSIDLLPEIAPYDLLMEVDEGIAKIGMKLRDINKIMEFVDCTDSALQLYRIN